MLDLAGVQVGGDHLVGPLAEALEAASVDGVEPIASMLEQLHERGDRLTFQHRPAYEGGLADLAFAIRNHYVDDDGNVCIDASGGK